MSRQVGAIILAAVTLMAWFPHASDAQNGKALSGKASGTAFQAPYRPSQVSQEFLSRLFPVKGRMYGDRRWETTPLANPGFSQDSRPFEQFQDKEAAQQHCWDICGSFMASGDKTARENFLALKNSGIAFIYLPPDDFDRRRWGGGGGNPDRLGRHILSFKRNDIYTTVVIQEDMIAFTFEYAVDPKKPELSLGEIQNKIAAICPFIEALVLEKIPPEEDYNGRAKAGLGKAKLKTPGQFNQQWIDSVRWWREPGRFGLASTIFKPNIPTGRIYHAPYTGN